MYKNIKAIVCDLDGTLYGSVYDPSEYTIGIIKKLKLKNYILGLASGRACEDVMSKADEWNLGFQFDFIIGFNGAQLYDDETKIVHSFNYINKNDLKQIISIMDEFNPNVHIYKPGIYLSSKQTDKALKSAFKHKRQLIVASSLEEFYDDDYPGIMFRVDPNIMPTIENKISNLLNKPYKGFKTQENLFEFSHKDTNKAYALKRYCDIKNININDVMAFGDTSNDNEMLACCQGVCLLNGSDDTKACATRITDYDANSDGFAHFIEDYLL